MGDTAGATTSIAGVTEAAMSNRCDSSSTRSPFSTRNPFRMHAFTAVDLSQNPLSKPANWAGQLALEETVR